MKLSIPKKRKKNNILNNNIAYAPTMSNYNFQKHEGITNGPTICIKLILSFLHRHNKGISFYIYLWFKELI